MKPYATSASLKAQARSALLGHYLPLSGAYFTLALFRYLIAVPSGLYAIRPPFGMILYYGIAFGLDVFFAFSARVSLFCF